MVHPAYGMFDRMISLPALLELACSIELGNLDRAGIFDRITGMTSCLELV